MAGILGGENALMTWTNKTTGLPFLVESWGVTRSLSQTFATARITTSNTFDIRLRDEIEIRALPTAGLPTKLMTGVVTSFSCDDSNKIGYEIKSKSAIMAESEAEPWDWTNSQGIDVIESICGEFGVIVGIDPAIEASDKGVELVIDPGTTALGVILDICHQRGWVIEDVDDGSIWITSVGSESYITPLARGIPPLISGSFTATDQRINKVYAERILPGEKRRGKAKVEDVIITGEATDTGAREGTKAYMRSNTAATASELGYLAAVRALTQGAGGISYTATCHGLFSMDFTPWAINKLITITDPLRRVNAWTGLVETVDMSGGAGQAQRTILTVVPPAVYYGEEIDALTGATATDPFRGLTAFR